MPRRKVTPEMVEKMKELRKQGLSYQKIAAKLGLSVMTVYNHLKKFVLEAEEKKEKKGFFARLFGR